VRQLSKQNKERTNLDKLIATEIKHIDNQIRADCLWHCFGRAPTVPAFVNADKILQQLSAVEVSWPITRNDASNAESAQVIVWAGLRVVPRVWTSGVSAISTFSIFSTFLASPDFITYVNPK